MYEFDSGHNLDENIPSCRLTQGRFWCTVVEGKRVDPRHTIPFEYSILSQMLRAPSIYREHQQY